MARGAEVSGVRTDGCRLAMTLWVAQRRPREWPPRGACWPRGVTFTASVCLDMGACGALVAGPSGACVVERTARIRRCRRCCAQQPTACRSRGNDVRMGCVEISSNACWRTSDTSGRVPPHQLTGRRSPRTAWACRSCCFPHAGVPSTGGRSGNPGPRGSRPSRTQARRVRMAGKAARYHARVELS